MKFYTILFLLICFLSLTFYLTIKADDLVVAPDIKCEPKIVDRNYMPSDSNILSGISNWQRDYLRENYKIIPNPFPTSQIYIVEKIATLKYNNQLACDTDGAPKDSKYAKSDKHYCEKTSYMINGSYIDATKINYIVYPSASYIGSLGIVIDLNTGNYVCVVCGDCNPYCKNTWREVSLHALWDMGYKNASGNNAPNGDFVSIILNDSRINSYDKTTDINTQIEKRVIEMLKNNNIDINLLIAELLEEGYGDI